MESLQATHTGQGNPADDETNQATDWKRAALDILETLILAVVLDFGINAVSARVRVDGFSMNPSIANGEYILVNKLAYRLGEPVRGDIIVFSFPLDPEQDLIKRVIGLPGETVTVQNGSVSVNGILLEEPYIAAAPRYDGAWRVEDGTLFVLGDNRNNSSDSKNWGPLRLSDVIGKAVLVYWPLPDIAVIPHYNLVAAAEP